MLAARIMCTILPLVLMQCAPYADEQLVQKFNAYDFAVKSVAETTDDGFLLNCDDRLVKLTSDGTVAWTKMYAEIIPGLQDSSFYVSQSISTPSGRIILLASLVVASNISLRLYYLDANGNVEKFKQFAIANDYRGGGRSTNEESYIESNNYPLEIGR